MKFDINKVICISLKSHNHQQLKAISEFYKLDFDGLIKIKESFSKIWVESSGEYAIAFVSNLGDGDIEINDMYLPITKREKDSLLKIKPMKTPKKPKNLIVVYTEVEDVITEDISDIVLDVDVILDKISFKGIESLTKEELDFLDNQ